MKPIWLVIANRTQARIFSASSSVLDEFNEIDDLTHLESRLHDRQLTCDLPGKIKSGAAGGHAFEQPTDPKKHEVDSFAHFVADYLESAHNVHAFSRLAVIAEPVFLGLLRHCYSEPLKRLICFELDRNLTHCNAQEIRDHLPDYLPELPHI